MRVKVHDSKVPERETTAVTETRDGSVILCLTDVDRPNIALDVIMTPKEAYQMSQDLLTHCGGLYGVQ